MPQPPRIASQPPNSVRMNAAQVGLNQCVGYRRGIFSRYAYALQCGCTKTT